ncbi:hypothetical protein [Nitrososphaera viennensis]|uniref:Uncharacterized protein n=2 Tax=Nitrososphaera viennensis TaxID=1034015 RepID=A0A060HJW7_9ARCH|nr:hypothetical protein [Nitrososphaera viennensis]AIC16829.1 exported protein of unknown function [Nitrososphaera viennensis EN76]UVS68735.1 hypothetical protein NWT39_12615 [Nitrososphaera viennensis]
MAGTRFAVYAAIAVAASVALIAVSLSVVPALTTSALSQGEEKRVVAFEQRYNYSLGKETWAARSLKLGDIKPDSYVVILNPFSTDMGNFVRQKIASAASDKVQQFWAKTEPYSHYNLVRLPAWLGGQKDDVSSLRAYSAIAISSGCLSRYWGDGRWAIEDPCHGDRYRPWDGFAFEGPAAVGITSYSVPGTAEPVALATLALSVDKDGYITAKKPDLSANGAAGQGRRLSQDELSESNAEMLAAASQSAGYALPFPTSASGKALATIKPAQVQWNVRVTGDLRAFAALYVDYSTFNYDRIEIAAYPVESYPDLALGDPPADLAKNMLNAAPSEGQHVKSGPGIAGRYAVLVANEGPDPGYAEAKLWGKGTDGTDLFVTITATGMTMDELTSLAKSLGLGPED